LTQYLHSNYIHAYVADTLQTNHSAEQIVFMQTSFLHCHDISKFQQLAEHSLEGLIVAIVVCMANQKSTKCQCSCFSFHCWPVV